MQQFADVAGQIALPCAPVQAWKENNLRIDFEDTSSSAGFASNDRGIVVNDNANGGANYFKIEDRGVDGTSANSVFRIDAGASGAVTLGFGSTASGAQTVSIGSTGSERRLTHVGNALAGTDAVNLAQMNAAIAAAGGGGSGMDADYVVAGVLRSRTPSGAAPR